MTSGSAGLERHSGQPGQCQTSRGRLGAAPCAATHRVSPAGAAFVQRKFCLGLPEADRFNLRSATGAQMFLDQARHGRCSFAGHLCPRRPLRFAIRTVHYGQGRSRVSSSRSEQRRCATFRDHICSRCREAHRDDESYSEHHFVRCGFHTFILLFCELFVRFLAHESSRGTSASRALLKAHLFLPPGDPNELANHLFCTCASVVARPAFRVSAPKSCLAYG